MRPTVGRVVHFNEGTAEAPIVRAAHICHVHSETMVNLMVISKHGGTMGVTSIEQGGGNYQWDWMLYQKEKAEAGDVNSESAEPRPELPS